MGLKPAMLVMIARFPKSVATFNQNERGEIRSFFLLCPHPDFELVFFTLKWLRPEPLDNGEINVSVSSIYTIATISISIELQSPPKRGLICTFPFVHNSGLENYQGH